MAPILRRVFANHEALIFRRGRIYPESFVWMSRHDEHYQRLSVYSWFLLKNYWLRRGAVSVPSGLWLIDNFSPDNYHHWMIDVLPRALRAEQEHPDVNSLLLPRYYRNQPYISFTLRAFPKIQRVGWIGARAKVRVDELAFVPRQMGGRLKDQLKEVARRVGELAGPPDPAPGIYFSRADAAWRNVRNEKDVIRVLRAHGIEPVQTDPAKPWVQIRAALGAKLVVGVHGAALTNLMFLQPGSAVLELRPDLVSTCYAWLAESLGLQYRSQDCEFAEPRDPRGFAYSDIMVDLDLLRERLRQVGVAAMTG